ncbi:MAG: cupin domain-containing protein [Spirochaetales bacterium]|nr:cupin domain-containing protein [Spirochaetales bacterium]
MKTGKNYAMKNAGKFGGMQREVFHDNLELSGTEISLNRMRAGDSSPFVHAHKRNEEVYVFVSGKGMAFIDGDEFPVAEGDVLRVDPDGQRCFRADDSNDLCFICVQADRGSLVQHTRQDGYLVEVKPSWMQQ